jgi:putative flavoprotein involved in K+ transport
MKVFDVIVVGGDQSGLAVGYYIRRSRVSYAILDEEVKKIGV